MKIRKEFMMKHIFILITCLFLGFTVASCMKVKAIQTVEVTRLMPQTVEVTKVIPQTPIVTQIIQPSATNMLKLININREVPPVQEKEYYAGASIITQYYTFLGHGLYKNAYQILGSGARRHNSLDEYVELAKTNFKAVEIVSIVPYYIEVRSAGGIANPDQEKSKKLFYVQIKAWGEGNMSGSRINGELQTLFLWLVEENGQWKIDTFATAPFH